MNVSVVIPLFNKASHIARAIDSVLAQTYTEFELIVIDDGSTDGGGDVVRRYTDPRVRLIAQANAGVSAARNRGVEQARSPLIAFLDGDDQWAPEHLDTLLTLRRQFPHAAMWATDYVFSSGGKITKPRSRSINPKEERKEAFLLDYFVGNAESALTPSCVMVHKDHLQAVGGFPVGVVRDEDHDTWMRLALRHPIAWAPRCSVTLFEDAENRSDQWWHTGNAPFFQSLHDYLREVGEEASLPEGVYTYLGRCHTRLLLPNLLTGNREAMHEILRDCRAIPGYRLRCRLWYLLSWIPQPMAVLLWRLRRMLQGRSATLPPIRNVRRSDCRQVPMKLFATVAIPCHTITATSL